MVGSDKRYQEITGEAMDTLSHPLYTAFAQAVQQATRGKGERHGGDMTPFLEQPWVHYAKMHGRGFLTGQAAKKLEEAASKRHGQAFVDEVLGAMVYLGMAVLYEQGLVDDEGESSVVDDHIIETFGPLDGEVHAK